MVKNDGRLGVLRAFSTPKSSDTPNEDRWRTSEDGAIWAVSDGASVSYDSGRWAENLVARFIDRPEITAEWIDSAIIQYESGYDREAMEWMQQAAFDRGSFATLLGGLSCENGESVRLFAVGDSICTLIDGTEVVRTLPYSKPEEFDSVPRLLSTNRMENRQFSEEAIAESWFEVDLSSFDAPKLLLMTDAVGRWLLEGPDAERVSCLLEIDSDAAFTSFVERERAEGHLRRDDSTLLVIGRCHAVPANY